MKVTALLISMVVTSALASPLGKGLHNGHDVRALDSLGGGNILRQLDSLGGGNILRSAMSDDEPIYYYRHPSGMTFGMEKKNFDEIDRSGGFGGFAKKNFDEIDRSGGFGGFSKKNFDEIDRAGFGGFAKRPAAAAAAFK